MPLNTHALFHVITELFTILSFIYWIDKLKPTFNTVASFLYLYEYYVYNEYIFCILLSSYSVLLLELFYNIYNIVTALTGVLVSYEIRSF